MFPVTDLSRWIIDVKDARMSIFPANDDFETCGFHPEVEKMFNPCLSLQSIIDSQRQIIHDSGMMFALLAEILTDRTLVDKLPDMAKRCEDMSKILEWRFEDGKA